MENLIIFINYSHSIPTVLGLFGKENLEYISEFNEKTFRDTTVQIYYHKKLNAKIYLYDNENAFLNQSIEFFNQFSNKLIFVDCFGQNTSLIDVKLTNISNIKKCMIWPNGEVLHSSMIEPIKNNNYYFILSSAKRPELENDTNFHLDMLLSIRYYKYYLGYYYLEELIHNIPITKYDINKPKLFSYIRTNEYSNWRTDIINNVDGLKSLLHPKNSANDAYDLTYTKYKHFEAINDYLYCNFNLIFETIDYRNPIEYFITEKTYKGLIFGKPFLLVAPYPVLNLLKDLGFYLINFEFLSKIETSKDVIESIDNFTKWINNTSDGEIEERYNSMLEKSINNRKLLFNYLNDCKQNENLFEKLLNE